MKIIYKSLERSFEKLTAVAIVILGNSITFFLALCLVIFWLCNKQFYVQDIRSMIGELILGIAFLSLFIIQKSFNRFSASLHLKLNELIASHEPANNTVINSEHKTEEELNELSKEYAEMAELKKEEEENS